MNQINVSVRITSRHFVNLEVITNPLGVGPTGATGPTGPSGGPTGATGPSGSPGAASGNIYNIDGALTGHRILAGAGYQLNLSGLSSFSLTSENGAYCTTTGKLQILSVSGDIEISGAGALGNVSLLQPADKLFIPNLAANNLQTKILVWNSADGKLQYMDISSLPGQVFQNLPEYDDNTAALSGGLLVGATYRITGTGTVQVVI